MRDKIQTLSKSFGYWQEQLNLRRNRFGTHNFEVKILPEKTIKTDTDKISFGQAKDEKIKRPKTYY